MLLFIIYFILGYWATGQTLFYNKIYVGQIGGLFLERCLGAIVLGWLLIPIALVLKLIGAR